MLAFYLDHHVHRAICEGLRRREIDVDTALEDGRATDDDEALLERAEALGRILVTQDQDILEIAPRWQKSARPFSGIVYAVQHSIDIGGTIEYLELIAHLKSPEEIRDCIEFIPAR